MHDQNVERRIERLEARIRRTQIALVASVGFATTALSLGLAQPDKEPEVVDQLRTRRLIVLDDQDTPRVVIGQDPVDTERRSRAAGITLHDKSGAERGGISTFDDDSVVFALDAPVGVGSPVRDRLGLLVNAAGEATLMLLDNETKVPVRLVAEADGSGGVEFIEYDTENNKAIIKRISFEGESKTEISLDR